MILVSEERLREALADMFLEGNVSDFPPSATDKEDKENAIDRWVDRCKERP